MPLYFLFIIFFVLTVNWDVVTIISLMNFDDFAISIIFSMRYLPKIGINGFSE